MNTWIISGIILLIGLIICIFLILRKNWKAGRKNIEDYQEGRDKLTYRKKKEDVIEVNSIESLSNFNSKFNLQSFIIYVVIIGITLVIGLSICSQLEQQINSANVSSQESIAANQVIDSINLVNPIGLVVFALILGSIIITIIYLQRGKNEN